jgi:hypothetical protein
MLPGDGGGQPTGILLIRWLLRTAGEHAMADEPIRFDDGAAYEQMMGVWSRLAGEIFLDWVHPPRGLVWADVGCGNGAFTELVASLRNCPLDDASISEGVRRLGLEPWLVEPIADYSLGTRAKLSIVAALVGAPPLLVLDESLNGLDPVAAWEVKQMLRELASSGRHAIIISTHVVETIPALCIGAVLLAGGGIAARWDNSALAAALHPPGAFEAQVMATLRAPASGAERRLSA